MTHGPKPRTAPGLSVLESWKILTAPRPGHPIVSFAGMLLVIVLLNLGAIAAIGSVSIANPSWAAVFGLVHVAVVPGLLLAIVLLPHDEVDLAEWIVLAAGLSILVLVLGGLLLALFASRVGPQLVVLWTSAVTLALGVAAFKRSLSWRIPSLGDGSSLRDAALLAALAAVLRLPGLGYAEFQGDETEVMLRAAGVVQGIRDAIFYHGKGPGEIVVVATLYGLLDAINEAAARLPFALAGVMGVVAFYVLARRLIGRPAALVAALLLATNGFFVAFSRITQYQSLVLLLGVLAIWCAVRWSMGGSGIWPTLAAVFAATAALAHYDALFVIPPIALAFIWRTGWRGLLDVRTIWPWFRGFELGLAILAAFFVPYLMSPLFALATGRIADRVGAGFPHNNLSSIVAAGTLYLGTVYPLVVAMLILLGAAVALVGHLRRRRVGVAATAPEVGQSQHIDDEVVGWGPGRVWLFGLVWAIVPLLFYAFVARKPGTHVHVASLGLLILAGAGFQALWTSLGRFPRLALAGLTGIGLIAVAAYLGAVYLWHAPELVRSDRVATLPLSWTPPGGLPRKERFGFPYEMGWKAIGALYANGSLHGSYDSNEQPQVTYWYTQGAWRCSATPRYYIIAEDVQDEIETPRRVIASQYHPIGTVTVDGQPRLRVYDQGSQAGIPQQTWPVEQLAPTFDRPLSAPRFDPGLWARGVFARGGTASSVAFGDAIQLLGYQVYAEDPRPGGTVRIDLFWLPRVTSDGGHRIDLQVGREQRIGDGGGPQCDKTRADQEWTAGQPFVQRLSVTLSPEARAGSYPLLVSVSRLGDGGGPLPARPAAGEAATGPVEIGKLEIPARGDGQ